MIPRFQILPESGKESVCSTFLKNNGAFPDLRVFPVVAPRFSNASGKDTLAHSSRSQL